jgi:hypothetical protein
MSKCAASDRGPREDCYELHFWACAGSAVYSWFAFLPMYYRVQIYILFNRLHMSAYAHPSVFISTYAQLLACQPNTSSRLTYCKKNPSNNAFNWNKNHMDGETDRIAQCWMIFDGIIDGSHNMIWCICTVFELIRYVYAYIFFVLHMILYSTNVKLNYYIYVIAVSQVYSTAYT